MPNNKFHYDSSYIDIMNLISCISVHNTAIHEPGQCPFRKKNDHTKKKCHTQKYKDCMVSCPHEK